MLIKKKPISVISNGTNPKKISSKTEVAMKSVLWVETGIATRDAIIDSTWDAVWAAIWAARWPETEVATRDAIRDAILWN